jgi:hypothetical protein
VRLRTLILLGIKTHELTEELCARLKVALNVRFCTTKMDKARKLHMHTELLFNENYLYYINIIVQLTIFTTTCRPCDMLLASH